jgi:hypothetical protein
VSRDKVDAGYQERFGFMETHAFERLCETPFSPWTVDCLWENLDYAPVYESPLSWHMSRDNALRTVISAIDFLRLYPDTIEESDEGALKFSAGEKVLFVCQPMQFWQPDASVRERCKQAFEYRPDRPPGAFAVATKLPGLSGMPHAYLNHDSRLASKRAELLQFTPADAAHVFVEIAASQNIRLELETAQAAVAQGVGFPTWEELERAWASLQAFQPYLVLNTDKKERFFCKDEADALAALAEAAGALEPASAHQWFMTLEHVSSFVFGIKGPPESESPRARTSRRRHGSDERPVLVRIRQVSPFASLPHHLKEYWRRPPYEVGTVDMLRSLLGITGSGPERVALSDARKGVTSLDISGVHITRYEDYIGRTQFDFELLDATTGWPQPVTRETWHPGNGLLHYEEDSDVELILDEQTVTLVQKDHKDKTVPLFRFGGLKEEERRTLLAFLRMTTNGSKGQYLRDSAYWSEVSWKLSEKEQNELWRNPRTWNPPTLLDRRQAHRQRLAEKAERK